MFWHLKNLLLGDRLLLPDSPILRAKSPARNMPVICKLTSRAIPPLSGQVYPVYPRDSIPWPLINISGQARPLGTPRVVESLQKGLKLASPKVQKPLRRVCLCFPRAPVLCLRTTLRLPHVTLCDGLCLLCLGPVSIINFVSCASPVPTLVVTSDYVIKEHSTHTHTPSLIMALETSLYTTIPATWNGFCPSDSTCPVRPS